MKRVSASLLAITALLATALLAQSTHSANPSSSAGAQSHAAFAGVWRVQIHGLPAVTFNLSYETGSLNGAILFYLLRKNPGSAETSTPGIPEPLIDPHFDGVTLTFAVSHRHAHPPESLSTAPVHFRMRITAAGQAELTGAESPTVALTRDSD